MKFRVARVEEHEADEGGHVRDAVERGVEEAAEARYLIREARDLAVEHIEEVGDDEDESGPEEVAEGEHETAQDVYRNARHGQKVRVDPAPRESLHHRADDPARAASDARPEQLYKASLPLVTSIKDAPSRASTETSHHRNAPECLSRKVNLERRANFNS